MTKDDPNRRDQRRNIGEEVLQAIRDIKAGKIGRIWRVESESLELVRRLTNERRIKVKLEDL